MDFLFSPSDQSAAVDRAAVSLDLNLSISAKRMDGGGGDRHYVRVLREQAAEQLRLAAVEKAYAAHLTELTKREMELAGSELSRAAAMWEVAKEEMKRAERMRAALSSSTTCMEITCLCCPVCRMGGAKYSSLTWFFFLYFYAIILLGTCYPWTWSIRNY